MSNHNKESKEYVIPCNGWGPFPSRIVTKLTLRMVSTIILSITWLSFLTLFLAFYASSFTILQNIAVSFVSLLITFGVTTIIWVIGLKKTGWEDV